MIKVELLQSTVDPEFVVAVAAKLCYSQSDIESLMKKQTPEGITKFIRMLTDMGHESPIEHVNFSFAIEGVSRALTHQLVRHRIASYSQQSQRYVKESQFEYIIPPAIEKTPLAKKIFLETMERDQEAYDNIVEILIHKYIETEKQDKITIAIKECLGENFNENVVEYWNTPQCGPTSKKYVAKFKEMFKKDYNMIEKKAIEDARYVFPNAAETKIIVTMNARTLMNFFHHRCCLRAQWEIRQLAMNMLRICKNTSPILFEKAGAACKSGICPEGNMQCDTFKGKIPTKEDILNLIALHYNNKESI